MQFAVGSTPSRWSAGSSIRRWWRSAKRPGVNYSPNSEVLIASGRSPSVGPGGERPFPRRFQGEDARSPRGLGRLAQPGRFLQRDLPPPPVAPSDVWRPPVDPKPSPTGSELSRVAFAGPRRRVGQRLNGARNDAARPQPSGVRAEDSRAHLVRVQRTTRTGGHYKKLQSHRLRPGRV
jgi:hypothetical protein